MQAARTSLGSCSARSRFLAFWLPFGAPLRLFFVAGICERQSRVSKWPYGRDEAGHAADGATGRLLIVLTGMLGGEPDSRLR